jgi:hypothetical protein
LIIEGHFIRIRHKRIQPADLHIQAHHYDRPY